MRISSTIKREFELHVRLEELNNIPQMSGTVTCKISISNHRKNVKFQDFTKHSEVKNNRSIINYELVKPFKLYRDNKRDKVLDLFLTLEFTSEVHNLRTKLGSLKINLSDFLKINEYRPARYLLQESKVNSIVKVSVFWAPLPISEQKKSQFSQSSSILNGRTPIHPSSFSSVNSLVPLTSNGGLMDELAYENGSNMLLDHDDRGSSSFKKGHHKKTSNLSLNIHNAIPVKTSTPILASESSQLAGTPSSRNLTPNPGPDRAETMASSCIISDPRIVKMMEKSYDIPWNDEYQEFTPREAVDDIMDNSGLGFRKNDEGMYLVDLYSNKHQLHLDYTPATRVLRVNGDQFSVNSSSSTSSDDDMDEIDPWFGRSGRELDWGMDFSDMRRSKAKGHRAMVNRLSNQVDEKEIRQELKSWMLSEKSPVMQ